MRYVCLLLLTGLFFSCQKSEKLTKALIETEYGNMTVELYNSTPIHRDNFIKLANEGFYDDLLFHRVINNFMIQGGDPESRNAPPNKRLGAGGPGYQLDAEIGALHYKGALSAARQGDAVNPQKKSSGSQFYIVHGQKLSDDQIQAMSQQNGMAYTPEQSEKYKTIGGTPFLDNNYTVFGRVIEGLEVIDKIATVQTAPGDRPVQDVKMKVSIIN